MIITLIIVVIAAAAIVILLLCQPRKDTYTNAWFVSCDGISISRERIIL
jgi:hypothetical protein